MRMKLKGRLESPDGHERLIIVLDLTAEQDDSADPKRQCQPTQQCIPLDEQAHAPQAEVEEAASEQKRHQVHGSHVDARVEERVDVIPLRQPCIGVGEQHVDDAKVHGENSELPVEMCLDQPQVNGKENRRVVVHHKFVIFEERAERSLL